MDKMILVVDDEAYISRALSFMFKKEGYACETAENGKQALDMMGGQKPDLIFMDVDMPVKDGNETVTEIRKNKEWNDIHIIMLTAKGQEADRERGLQSGANEYILKPFDPKSVLKKVKEILG